MDAPLFKPLTPEVKALYDRVMQHGDNCQNDIAVHEHNLLMHQALFGSLFPGMQRLGAILIEQSRALEIEARELAYLLLTEDHPEPPFKNRQTLGQGQNG